MIPETLGALLAFLGLVAPGLVYELRREKRRPPVTETTFREASRVALTSLVFTVVALLIVSGLSTIIPGLPSLSAWVSEPEKYARDHYVGVATFLTLVVALSCLIGWLFEAASRREQSTVSNQSVWYGVFSRHKPAGTVRTWVRLMTSDGTQIRGALRTYATGESSSDFTIALGGGPISSRGPDDDDWESWDAYDAIIVQGTDLRYLAVSYLDADNMPLRASDQRQLMRVEVWRRRAAAKFRT